MQGVQDRYHLWVPIQDDEDSLLKSVEVDENGDYIVQGVMTSDDKDEENDSIAPEGMDCSYFLEKGWIKYEHGNRPDQFIGEPLEVRVGRFNHPTLNRPVNGIFVKGRLFANRELARQAVKTIEDLQKSKTKRCMGWSIEGQVKERDRKTGKIVKSVLRNVVLTMNPVNTLTWAELSKSFASDHALTIDCDEPMEKAMDTGNTAELAKQSLEGAQDKKKEQKEKDKKKLIRVLLKRILDDIKSTFFGGDKMSTKLASLLEEELKELQKSLDTDEAKELKKAMDAKEDEDKEKEDADIEEREDDSEEEEEEKEKTKKSLTSKSSGKQLITKLSKSLASEHPQAFEVSDFLVTLTDEIGFGLEGLEKSMNFMRKQNKQLVKSITSMMEVVQELTERVEELQADNETLKKSLEDIVNRPVGRKSVVTQKERATVQKSVETAPLSHAETLKILMKSFEAGEVKGSEIARYEAGVPLERLNLPESLKERLGII